MEEQSDNFMFPFLGRGQNATAKINILAPYHPNIKRLTCFVSSVAGERLSQEADYEDDIVRLYRFEFKGLKDGVEYKYWFSSEGKVVELGGGLTPDDLRFKHWETLGADDSVVLLSCNGVFDHKGAPAERWAMWNRLESEIVSSGAPPKLVIHGGDQYYQDAVEERWLKRLTDDEFPKVRSEFKRDALNNALKYWSHLSYRKVAAQIASVAMLDDHDITDGAGGRPEFFRGSEFTPEWRNYAEVQVELFRLLQASRNPSPIFVSRNSCFSFVLDLGSTALVALDLRTEKNSKNEEFPLMSEQHWNAVGEAITNLPHTNVMILIPVVPLRNSIKVEGVALWLAKTAAFIAALWKPQRKIWQQLLAGIKYIAGLEDDLSDALGSEVNKRFFAQLLRTLGDGARRGVTYTFLSGDIHTGGSVESNVSVDGFNFRVATLVSSPMGYQPMHYLVEAYLRDRTVIRFEEDGVKVAALNNAFTVNRNFMVVFPNRLAGPKTSNQAAYIFQEGVTDAKAVALQSWVPTTDLFRARPNLAVSKSPLKDSQLTSSGMFEEGGHHEL